MSKSIRTDDDPRVCHYNRIFETLTDPHFDHEGLSQLARHLLLVLAGRANWHVLTQHPDEPLWYSYAQYGAILGRERKAARRALRELEMAGYVETDAKCRDGIAARVYLTAGFDELDPKWPRPIEEDSEPVPPVVLVADTSTVSGTGKTMTSTVGGTGSRTTCTTSGTLALSVSFPEVLSVSVARARTREGRNGPDRKDEPMRRVQPDANTNVPGSEPDPSPAVSRETPSRPARRSDDPEPPPESEMEDDEYQDDPGASPRQAYPKPVVKSGGKFGFNGGQPTSREVRHPTGPIGRVVAHFLESTPDFHYDPSHCERFRKLLGEWLDLEGTVEDVCEMMDTVSKAKFARDGDPPKWLTYFNESLQEMVRARKQGIAKGETGFYAGIRPAPDVPEWKQVRVLLDELDAKYGDQANSITYAKYLKEAGLAEYTLEDERTFSSVLGRLFRKFPESDHEDLPYRLRVALGAPPKQRPRLKPVEVVEKGTRPASETIAEMRARITEYQTEHPEEPVLVKEPTTKVDKPPEIDELESMTVEELLSIMDPLIAADLREIGVGGENKAISMERLRQWAREARHKEGEAARRALQSVGERT